MAAGPDETADRDSKISDRAAAFVRNAAQTTVTGAAIGCVAADRTTNPQVRDFVRELLRDHASLADRIQTVARSEGVELRGGIASALRTVAALDEQLPEATPPTDARRPEAKRPTGAGEAGRVFEREAQVEAPAGTPQSCDASALGSKLDAAHRTTVDKALSAKGTPAFDHRVVSIVADQYAAQITQFEAGAATRNAAVEALAQGALPHLRENLQAARDLELRLSAGRVFEREGGEPKEQPWAPREQKTDRELDE